MNDVIAELLQGSIALALIIVASIFWPIARKYVGALEATVLSSQMRRDFLDYVLAARRLYDDNGEAIAYVMEMAKRRYPDLDVEHTTAQIEAAFDWIDRNLDLEIYVGNTIKGKK